MAKNSRSAARARAFQVLYSVEFSPVATEEALEEAFRSMPRASDDTPADVSDARQSQDFAWELVEGVWNHFAELDAAIGKHSHNWRVDRLGRVELTVLRLGMFELLHQPETPSKVIINEALELASRFANPQSRHFINGILDAAAKGRVEKKSEFRKPESKSADGKKSEDHTSTEKQ